MSLRQNLKFWPKVILLFLNFQSLSAETSPRIFPLRRSVLWMGKSSLKIMEIVKLSLSQVVRVGWDLSRNNLIEQLEKEYEELLVKVNSKVKLLILKLNEESKAELDLVRLNSLKSAQLLQKNLHLQAFEHGNRWSEAWYLRQSRDL